MKTEFDNTEKEALNKNDVSSSVFRYCWLNINDGKFSNSWSEEDMKYIDDEMLLIANKDGWKLQKYLHNRKMRCIFTSSNNNKTYNDGIYSKTNRKRKRKLQRYVSN